MSVKYSASTDCYSIAQIAESYAPLQAFMQEGRIDLGNPEALKAYNLGLLQAFTGFTVQLPPGFLIPTICLRNTYLQVIEDKLHGTTCLLDIGTGASMVIALLAVSRGFRVHATEIDAAAIEVARTQITRNSLSNHVLQLHPIEEGILQQLSDDVLKEIEVSVTYPPFYPEDRPGFTSKKKRGFQGTDSELFGGQTGMEFTLQYFREARSRGIPHRTALLHKRSIVEELEQILTAENNQIEIIPIQAGTRQRFVIWSSD